MLSNPPSHLRNPRKNPNANPPQNRDSNMIRASVLDVALELGIGGFNSTVADWIFNNPLDESDESTHSTPAQHAISSGLGSGSVSGYSSVSLCAFVHLDFFFS
jgi:hypothetical protein